VVSWVRSRLCRSDHLRERLNTIDADPPSEEETQVMRAKWQMFFDTIGEVKLQAYRIADGILYESSYVVKALRLFII
jgi:hypothetical protein